MSEQEPIFTPASHSLKDMVGHGGLPNHVLRRAQEYLDNCPLDYTQHAKQDLQKLKKIQTDIHTLDAIPKDTLIQITNRIMNLKSSGSMFHFHLISMISNVMLEFMDHVDRINADFMAIFSTYLKILETILSKNLRGNGSTEGEDLTKELQAACDRYIAKHGTQKSIK